MMKNRSKCYRKIVCIFLTGVLLISLFSGCQGIIGSIGRIDPEQLTVSALSQSDGMVALDTQFLISGVKISAQRAEKVFCFDPPVSFSANSSKEGLTLSLQEPLPANSIVNLQLIDEKKNIQKSWAFQTQIDFAIERVTPQNQTEYVPLDSGIEVVFTYPNIETSVFEQYFSLINEADGNKVAGTVEKHDRTLVFIPQSSLAPSAVYTAQISADMHTPDGKTLEEDYRFSFKTAAEESLKGDGSYFENASPMVETFLLKDAPLIAVNCGEVYRNVPIKAAIYQFASVEGYKEQLTDLAQKQSQSAFPSYVQPEVDISKLSLVSEYEAELQFIEDSYWGPKYFLLPDNIEKGYYYIRLTVQNPMNGKEMYLDKFIQMSDLSVFYLKAGNDTLFWLNDAGSGMPVSNADVAITGCVAASGKTNEEGVFYVTDTAAQAQQMGESVGVLEICSGDNTFIDLYTPLPKEEKSPEEKYVSYLYTDRPIYMSSDTVKIWGMVRPRGEENSLPDDLRVTLGDYQNDFYETPVELSPDGTFTAEISFEQLSGQEMISSYVRLKYGEDEALMSTWIEIGDFVKPVYVPSLTLDRPVYRAGEEIAADFSVTFFDNTPASGFTAAFEILGTGTEPSAADFKTGEDGHAVQHLRITEIAPDIGCNWRPEYLYYSAYNTSGENENIHFYDSIPVLYRDMAIQGSVDKTDKSNRVTIKTQAIDLSKIEKKSDLNDLENILGAPVDTTIEASLYKIYYTKTPSRTYYDFVQKKNVTTYDYTRHEEKVSTTTFTTSGGSYVWDDLPLSDDESTYYIILEGRDLTGRLVQEKIYLGYEMEYWDQSLKRFSFVKRGAENDYDQRHLFDESQVCIFDVYGNGEPVNQGKILWAIVQDNIKSYYTSDTAQFTVDFAEELVPNYILAGAYFDGSYIYPIARTNMQFDPKNRALELEITPDQEQYAPGDTARVDVKARYKSSGLPASGASLSLSVVDEAVFAIREQEPTPLSDLYRGVYYPYLEMFASYVQYNFLGNMAGEKGGGGGESGIRTDFKDTAVFLTATADENGSASFSFPLPDNITSWRATAQAISEDLYAGNEREDLIVTGTFFINEVLPTQMIAGDDATVTLRSYGSAIQSGDMVDYTVTVKDAKGEQKSTATASCAAGDLAVLPIGKLEKGDYVVTMQAKCGSLEDGIEKTLQVVESGIEVSMSQTFDLAEGLQIDAVKFPITLGIYNSSYETYADVLNELNSASGYRADERVARDFALKKMMSFTDEGLLPQKMQDRLEDVIKSSGSVSLFPYDSYDLILSAKMHLAAPEYLVGGDPVAVFENALVNGEITPEQRGAAYLGLAAHKKPVLNQVRSTLADDQTLTEEERLYFIAALAALGDYDGARTQYNTYVTPNLQYGQSVAGKESAFIDKGEIEENLRYTALASLTASILNLEDAGKMMYYLLDNNSLTNLYLLEEMVYLRYTQLAQEEKASISYERDGKKQKVDLQDVGLYFVRLTEEEYKNADFKVLSGNVGVKAFYIGSPSQVETLGEQQITLSKMYEPESGSDMEPGTVVKVTVKIQMDDRYDPQCLVINDYIPSGMRYLSLSDPSGDVIGKSMKSSLGWRLLSREEQRLTFVYDDPSLVELNEENTQPTAGEKKFTPPTELVYYVRCAVPGSYVADGAFATSQQSPIWGMSERTMVEIHDPS